MLSSVTTPQDLDERFRAELAQLPAATVRRDPEGPVRDGTALTGVLARRLFDAQLASRHLDLAARWLRSFNEGYYTIGSAGHEGNAAVAAAVQPTDPALLHYRSGAFYCARATQVPGSDAIRDVLRGLVASAREPIAGGRHKVYGHPNLNVIPTTSTVGSHLPRAVGVGFGIEWFARRARRANGEGVAEQVWPSDSIAVCSFGDASVNHATATAAFNTAGWCDHTGLRLPVLFVCEDNGFGISVRSPDGWVAATLRGRPGLRYFATDGCDLAAVYDAASEAATWVRRQRRPAVLHLSMVRLMGHAGADAEQAYRSPAEISADLASAGELLRRSDEVGWQVRRLAEEVLAEPKLGSPADIIAPLAPRRPARVSRAVGDAAARLAGADGPSTARVAAFSGRLPEEAGPLTLAQTINAALTDTLLAYPQMVVFGEDVAVKGGVYGVTKGLRERFGATRVFDTLLDKTSILGLVVAAPARAEDAGPMLRTCLAAAVVDGSVCVFLEPIALYHTRDLHAEGDGGLLSPYAGPDQWTNVHVPIGRARLYEYGSAEDLTVITFGNGVPMSLRAAAQLAEDGVGCRVLDLRWLSPLPVADIIRESSATGRVLVVDETRRSGGVGEGVLAALVDAGYVGVARRVAAVDSFIPLGPAAAHVLISEDQVVQGARSLLSR